MLKRCSNCKHCIMDWKALFIGNVYLKKCAVNDRFIHKPFWSGWRCKNWRAEDGK